MIHPARSFVVVAALLGAACTADDGIPDDHGQLEAHVDSDPAAPYHTYLLYVVDVATSQLVFEDSLAVDEIVGPSHSRFVAALPAKRPLLVGIVATDANHVEVGAGSVVISLAPQAKTAVEIQVLAHAAGRAGSLDATVSNAQLPDRHVLSPSPAANEPGNSQQLYARLTDNVGLPVTDAVAVDLAGAVAPMFTPADGGVTTTFSWAPVSAYPATARARIAHLDPAGRGWVGTATTKFEAAGTSSVIDVAWTGQIHASGDLPNGGRWLLGPYDGHDEAVAPCGVAVYADADGDGTYTGTEITHYPRAEAGSAFLWTAPQPLALANPSAVVIAGALVDSDGKSGVDTFLALAVDGTVHVTPWPLDNSSK